MVVASHLETRSMDGSQRGLLEGATPECSSPLSLITYQSAQDDILSESTQSALPGPIRLLKNSCDSRGHVFGQHENYEMEVASGLSLIAWRTGLVLLLPLLVTYKVLSVAWFASMQLANRISRIASKVRDAMKVRWSEVRGTHTEEERKTESSKTSEPQEESTSRLSPFWMKIAVIGTRCLHYPLAITLLLNVWCFALLRQRRGMSAYLASRVVWDGGGHIDLNNRFWLGARASTISSVIGFGSYWSEKPMFLVGHWLEGMCMDRWYRFDSWLALFAQRQRVQISLGDATPNQSVEYLRIGVTALVLDLIESEQSIPLPSLRNPVESLHRFASDWSLVHRAPDRSRGMWNAMEIQKEYLQAVRIFLQQSWSVPAEAWQVLQLWQNTVEHLGNSRFDQDSRHWLLGRVDWVSKKWLLDQVPADAGWVARKKIDLRYHELSQEGYQRRLSETLQLAPLVTVLQRDKARRNPPENSPATKRSYFIREFSTNPEGLRVDWNVAEIGEGSSRKNCAASLVD